MKYKKHRIVRKIARLLKKSLARRSVYIERMTDPQQIIGLAKRIRPVTTQFELIRIGGDSDGGYLLPDDLEDIAVCFSPGVAETSSFELSLQQKKGIASHLADYSVENPPLNYQPASFTKKFIGVTNDDVYMTMDKWVSEQKEYTSGKDFILQMDIEGWEYPALLNVSDEILKRFRIIVLEIHDIESWGNIPFFRMAEAFFSRLLQYFHVVHNHPNNCCGTINMDGFEAPRVIEITLLRKDRSEALGFCDKFPHPLDAANVSRCKDLVLPKCWYEYR